jgi:tetratricopeptide (TPR) repeat protein
MDAERALSTLTPERWVVLKGLFNRAIELGPSARGTFILEACGADRWLSDSLASLLRLADSSPSLMDDPAITLGRLAALVEAGGCRTFAQGELVANRFRIVQFLAEGGMGEVYAADDLELSERVALKTIRPLLAPDQAVLAKFKREVQLARRVTHRNVSRVFDLFRHEASDRDDSIAFVSMELLAGETLSQRIRRLGRLEPADARRIAMDVVAGLAAAHTAGVVHGDLKSGNVILVGQSEGPGGTDERAVITDFGLAGTLTPLAGDASPPEEVAGTPAYMAPEQVESGAISVAGDIYSLGVVLFEMIAGDVPFRADSPLATARLRLDRAAPALRAVVSGVSADWDRTVRACLQRDPRRRPPSATAVAHLLTGRTRRRRAVYAVAALCCVVGLSAGVWRWTHLPYRPVAAAQVALDTARVKRENFTTNGFRASIGDFRHAVDLDPNWALAWAELAYTYAAAGNTQQIPTAIAATEGRTAALQAIRRDPQSGKALGALGWVQALDFDDWPSAESSLRRAAALEPSDAQIHYWLGVHLRKKGNFSDAETEDRQAMVISHQSVPLYWWELAFLYWTSGRLDRMRTLMNELLVAYPNFGFTRFLNARLLKEQGRYDEALSELRLSEAMQYASVTVEVERASIDAHRGNAAAARARLDRLRELSRTVPVDTLLIAGVYARLGDRDAAFDWLEQGYARRDSTLLSMATSPLLLPLRGDARFASLMRRLHFSP